MICSPKPPLRNGRTKLSLACVAFCLISCAGSDSAGTNEPACLPEAVNTACTPEYEPTYDNVFTYTLSATCGKGGCHSGTAPKGGLALDDKATARDNLLATNAAGERRVIPGDVKCGKVIVRLETEGETWSMPPSNHLGDPALCSIAQWIADGAKP